MAAQKERGAVTLPFFAKKKSRAGGIENKLPVRQFIIISKLF